MANAILITAAGRVVLGRNGSIATNSVATPVGTVPGIPTTLAVGAITASSVSLSWSAPTSGTTPFTGYSIIYATSASGPWTTFGTASGTSAVVTGLSPTTLYYFAVAAINGIGTGPYTSPASATTAASIPVLSSVSPNSGTTAGGSPLTLTGSNFSTATSVTIGGLAVSFSIVNNTTITFISPAHAAAATSIAVTSPGGTSGSVTFTYSNPSSQAIPVWSAVSPWVVPSAAGTAITLTGSGFTGSSIIDPASGLPIPATVVSDTKITFAKPATNPSQLPYEFFVRNSSGDSGRFGLITGLGSAATTIDDLPGVILAGAPMTVYGYTYPVGAGTQLDVRRWSDASIIDTHAIFGTNGDGSWSVTFNAPTPGPYQLHSYTATGGTDSYTGEFTTVSSLTAPFLNDINPFAKVPGLAAPIIITGSQFTGATAVMFGNVAAPSFTVVDDATIKLPSAPDQPFGPVNVTVVGASGESSSPASFQYLHALAEPVPQSVGGAAPVVSSRWKGPWAAVNAPKSGQVTSVIIDPVHGNVGGTGSDGTSNNLWSSFDFLNPATLGYPKLADGGTVNIRAGTFTAGPWARGHLADFPGGINIVGVGANQVTLLNINTGPGGDKAMTLWQCNAYIYGVGFMMDGVDMQTGGYAAIRFNNDTGNAGSAVAHYIHVEKCRFNRCQEAITSDTGWTVTGENWCLYLKDNDFSPTIPDCYNSDILSHEVYSGAQQFWQNCNSYGPKYGTTHKGRSPSMTIVGCWTRRTLNRWIDYPESGVFQAWNSTFTEATPQYTSAGSDTDMHLFEYCSSTPNLTAAPTSPLFNNCDLWFTRGIDASDGATRAEDWMTPVAISFVNCRTHWSNQDGAAPRLIAVDPGDFSTHNDRIVGIPLSNPGTTFETLPAAPAFRTP